jgi:DNA-binding transcriptional MerR regulator
MVNTHKTFIPATDKIDLLFASYFNDEKALKIRHWLNLRNKGLDIDELSYRIINHWEKNGLIEVERGEDGKGWRKFSLMDAMWISVIIELRKFGVSIENLNLIKNQLYHNDGKYKPSFYPVLEFYTALFMKEKEPIYILIFNDFQVKVATKTEIELRRATGSIPSHITIELISLLRVILKKPNLETKSKITHELSEVEIQLLLEIRTRNYKSIKIRMKNGEINIFEKEIEFVEDTIHKLLKQKNYDEISIIREDGNIRNIKQIIKQKI